MIVDGNLVKSERLKKVRGYSFEEILEFRMVKIRSHPGRDYQELMLFDVYGYIWAVPFVRDGEKVFLKTLYPDRRFTKKFRRGEL